MLSNVKTETAVDVPLCPCFHPHGHHEVVMIAVRKDNSSYNLCISEKTNQSIL